MSHKASPNASAPVAGGDSAHRLFQTSEPSGAQPALPPSDERLSSWRDAMARAEQSASQTPCSGATPVPTGSESAEPAAAARTDAQFSEWSPMNPRGTVRANGGGTRVDGAPIGEQGLPGEPAGATPATEPAGAFADTAIHRSPQELLQLRRERLAMGLDTGTVPLQDIASDGAACGAEAAVNALNPHALEGRLAQPVSLVQTLGVGEQALPESERPVVEGMTLGELALERHVDQDRADADTQTRGAEVVAIEAKLQDINTPDSLPLETIQSA